MLDSERYLVPFLLTIFEMKCEKMCEIFALISTPPSLSVLLLCLVLRSLYALETLLSRLVDLVAADEENSVNSTKDCGDIKKQPSPV